MPHQAAGILTEPPVSVPIATGASPAEMATPEPLEDPPGVRWTARSHGLRGVPMCVLVPQLPMANSTVCVLPRTIIPAPMSRSASVGGTGDTRSAHTFAPPVVTRPSSSTRSLSAMGTPWSGPTRWPARMALSAASAASRASVSYTAIYACRAGLRPRIRPISASTASTGESVRAPNARDNSATVAHTGSIVVICSLLLPQRAALVRSCLDIRHWEEPMRSCTSRVVIAFVAIVLGFGVAGPAAAAPAGRADAPAGRADAPAGRADAPAGTMTWGVHITLASRWLDPGETEGIATPFMVLYALHDALVKPMPAGLYTPSLAESFTQSKDGLTYEFVIRKGARFHNGEPVTATDVKFSFDRYKGAGAKTLKERVREVQIVDPGRVRIHLREPWPDFMSFYGTTATGSGWIVPKAYVEKVGEDGFKKAPVG